MRPPTYARARLWTGIGGVGFVVVLAALGLALDVPTRLLAERGGTPASDFGLLFAIAGLGSLALLPFDLLGGLVWPRSFGRPHPAPGAFWARWLRGTVALAAVSAVSGWILLVAGRAGGVPAALVAFAAVGFGLLAVQAPLARLVGGHRRGGDTGEVVLSSDDPGFTGGFTGLAATSVVPARWREALDPEVLRILLERRRRIVRSGAWSRTRVVAVAWNTLGFGLACLVPGAGVESVAALATAALGFTLWTFVGLLLLPAPSRDATLRADALVVADEPSRERMANAVRCLDRLQDDEPERSAALESVFHPVPSVAGRLRALADTGRPRPAVWHLARTALYLSYAGLSVLPRAVHCNVGRPELWVYLPADG